MEIQRVKLDKDGMVMDVLKLLVLLDHIIMEHNAFVQDLINKNANLGNTLTASSVCTSLNNALLVLNGTRLLVFPLIVV